MYADRTLAAYRERFGNDPGKPDSSPDETGEALDAFCKALSHAQLPRARAATSYFSRHGGKFCVWVGRVDADEAASSTPMQAPDFSGAAEPITDDVLRSLGFSQGEYGPWKIPGDWLGTAACQNEEDNSLRLSADIVDARKLRAIVEILRA